MKRILPGIPALLLLAMLCGCGAPTAKNPQSAENSKAAASDSGTLAKIKREGVLKWGADPSGGAPFVYFDPKNPDKIIGFETDIMDKLAAHMGVRHEVVQGPWPQLLDNLKARRSDLVMNGYEITEANKKAAAFSEPYYVYEQQLTVRIEDKDKYKTLADLKGQKLGVLGGTEAERLCKREGFTDDQLISHDDSSTPYQNLDLRRVEAVVQESIIADFYAGKNPKLYNVPQTFSSGNYGAAVRLEDAALLKEIGRALDVMKKNGEMAEIYKRWHMWNERQKEIGVMEK